MEYFSYLYTCKPKSYKQIPTPMTDTNLIEIFCIFDDFCKYFTPELKKHTLQVSGKRHRNRASRMSDSEIMTILVLFHTHRFRDLVSCHIKRESQHRTMRDWAAKGKCTMGWFYGFKLHLVINDRGEIIQWKLTPGNVDDREPLKDKRFTREIVWKTLRRQGPYQSEPL